MNRGAFAVVGLTVLVLTTGCTGSPSPGTATASAERDAESPTVRMDGIEVEPGRSANLTIRAENVESMRFVTFPAAADNTVIDDLVVKLGHDVVHATPDIDSQADSYPPIWEWNGTESDATVTVPVRAAENAEPGTYTFEIAAENGFNAGVDSRATDNATVTVLDG